jgi:hypothetical protein
MSQITHVFHPVPRGRGRLEIGFDTRKLICGVICQRTMRSFHLGPLFFIWHLRNVNFHEMYCDCSACCFGCIANDRDHAARLLEREGKVLPPMPDSAQAVFESGTERANRSES